MLGRIAKYSCCVVACATLLSACGVSKKAASGEAKSIVLTDEQQGRFDAFFMEAVRQKQLGNIEEAFDLYSHCLEINPTASAVLYELSQFYYTLNQPQKALEYLRKAVALEPTNYWYKEALASYFVARNMYDDAIGVYEDIYSQFPTKVDALSYLLSLYEQKEDYQNVIATLNRIETLEGKSEKISVAKFRIYFLQNNRKKAFSEIESLIAEYPNDDRYRNMLGELYLENDEPDKALTIFQDILREDSANTNAQVSMLAYYSTVGNDSLYRKNLLEVVRNPKLDSDNRLNLARAVVAMNEERGDTLANVRFFDQMLSQSYATPDFANLAASYIMNVNPPRDTIRPILEKCVRLSPEEIMPTATLLQWAISDNDMEKVIELCRPASEYHPEIPTFSLYLAIAYFQSDRSKEALEVIEKALDADNENADPEIMTEMYALLGDLRHEKGDSDGAFEAYESALSYKSSNIGVLNNYAYYLSLMGEQLEKAEDMSYRTVKAEPSNWTYLDTYAWILFKEERYSEAHIYIDEALKNGGRAHADIIEHAGDIYFKSGDKAGALVLWKEALEAGSESKTIKRKIKLKKYIE